MAATPPVPPDPPSRVDDVRPSAAGHSGDGFSGGSRAVPATEVEVGERAAPRSFAAELPVLILIAFVLAVLLKTFLVQAFYIPSGSMEPTLAVGDRVLVNKVIYDLRDPRRGEVIVFGEDAIAVGDDTEGPLRRFARSLAAGLGLAAPAEKDFIKRVIGLPGDTIEQREGQIYINGDPLAETTVAEGGYISARDPQNDFGPLTVPEREYFVMGDNRPNSSDSRFSLGTIPRDDVVGRAFVVIWPFDHLRGLGRADYGARGDLPTALEALLPAATERLVALASWS